MYQYSCAATCTAGSNSGVTTSCCYASINCNTIYKLSTCIVGTDNAAVSASCTNSGYCRVNKRIIESCFKYNLV